MRRTIASCLIASLFLIDWSAATHTVKLNAQESAIAATSNTEVIDRLKADMDHLASDAMEGRGVGTKGLDVAADFIATRYAELGLTTDLFDGSPFQKFSMDGPIVVGDQDKNKFALADPEGANNPLELNTDYVPLSLGSNGKFEGPLVFVGYGITAQEDPNGVSYDDYAGLDVAGKVVVVLRKEPQQNDSKSAFNGTDPSQYSYFSTKMATAAAHKAAGVILVNDQATAAAGDVLPKVDGAGRAFSKSQVPAVWVKRERVEKIIEQATGKKLEEIEKEIDSDMKPRSSELTRWQASGEVELKPSKVELKNVIATLPGQGALAEEFVVVGAHYDHVGMGGQGSLAPETIAVHNGADDNASGTVCLLEVARQLKSNLSGDRRTVVFMAFSAEERGLIGSRHYVRNPRFDLGKTAAMVNMDMVGRLTGDSLTIFGTETAKSFGNLLTQTNEKFQFSIEREPYGYGPSDHQSFFEVKIPVLHFFTGLHNDYHRPSDDSDKINIEGMASIAKYVEQVVSSLATTPDRPEFVEVKGRAIPKRQPPGRLGVETEDNPTSEMGVYIRRVEPGRAASNAGIELGDLILRVDGQAIESPRILAEILANTLPGQVISVEVMRDRQLKKIDVKLWR